MFFLSSCFLPTTQFLSLLLLAPTRLVQDAGRLEEESKSLTTLLLLPCCIYGHQTASAYSLRCVGASLHARNIPGELSWGPHTSLQKDIFMTTVPKALSEGTSLFFPFVCSYQHNPFSEEHSLPVSTLHLERPTPTQFTLKQKGMSASFSWSS